MNGQGEIMVPVSDADVGRMAIIEAMRVQSDHTARIANSVEKVSDQVTEMAKDIAVLKAQDYQRDIDVVIARQVLVDERIANLLAASLEDRKNLWLAVEVLKGESASMKARTLPIFGGLAMAGAAVIAFIMERLLK